MLTFVTHAAAAAGSYTSRQTPSNNALSSTTCLNSRPLRNSHAALPSIATTSSRCRRSTFVSTAPLTSPPCLLSRRAHASGQVSMKVATDNDNVLVHYTGYLDDGTQFDTSYDRGQPLNFILGAGNVIRGFDDAVRGLSPGESRRTRIEPDRAYGIWKADLVFSIPPTAFPTGISPDVGKRVPLSNGMSATIVESTKDAIKLDANHELAGKALTFDMMLVAYADTVLSPPADGLQRAVFGLGCFWGAELAYQRVAGVVSTKVGYTQGQLEAPTYEQVCSGSSGHTEAIAADFDPKVVSYEQLVNLFWERLGDSALKLNQVGNDVGTQYRSGIYYMDDAQRTVAEESVKVADQKFGKKTVVEVVSSVNVPFYVAEGYHQQYLENGGQSAVKGDESPIRCYG